jgi:hypothetical protein
MLFDPGGGAPGVIRMSTGTYRAFLHTVHIGLSNILYLLAHTAGAFINTAGTYYAFIHTIYSYKDGFHFSNILQLHMYSSFSRVHLLLQMGFSYWHGLLTVLSVVMGSNNTSNFGVYWTFMNTTGTYCTIGFLIQSM